jgi:archaellum component FlaC
MFKNVWNKLFQKKEESMTTAQETAPRSEKRMKKQMSEQNVEIGKLRARINDLVDDMAVLQNDLNKFKKNVSKDLLDVIDAIKEGK